LSVNFKLVKWSFTTVGRTPGKIHYCPLWEKSFQNPCSTCTSGLLKYFCICPIIYQTHHFATTHLCWCNNTIVHTV